MMFDGRCLIFDVKRNVRSRCALRTSTIKHQTSNLRDALTLIELLVVIVILTTLVAGVIPILSPNNDTRKIREASRMLQTYIMKAQSEAARTGRDQGIAFRETSSGSGVALDVFRLEVPPAFAGFSSASAARIIREETAPSVFKYYIQFVLSDTATGGTLTTFPPDDYLPDPVPPRMIRKNDSVLSGGFDVQVTDLNGLDVNEVFYISTTKSLFLIDYTPSAGQTLAFVKFYSIGFGGTSYALTAPKPYKFIRQPVNSVEEPLQFPAGIAVDLQGSIAEGPSTGGFPTDGSLFISPPFPLPNPPPLNTVGIMFSPSGSVSNVFLNSTQLTNVSRIAVLLGRVENGGLTNSTEWTITAGATNDALAELQNKINWLNLDSRWLFIAPNSGRAIVSENAFVDTRNDTIDDDGDGDKFNADADEQIEAAHEFGHEMRSTGAGR